MLFLIMMLLNKLMEITISEIPIPKNISNSTRMLVSKKSLY